MGRIGEWDGGGWPVDSHSPKGALLHPGSESEGGRARRKLELLIPQLSFRTFRDALCRDRAMALFSRDVDLAAPIN